MKTITASDIATYLGAEFDSTDNARAGMLIDGAISQALSVVTIGEIGPDGKDASNLPDGAEFIIYAAVGRVMVNPTMSTQDQAGSFMVSGSAGTGALFSDREKRALRALAGSGGAFSVDMLAGTDWAAS